MLSRLEDIRLSPSFPWIETLLIVSKEPCDLNGEQVHDDLKRELSFYKQALAAAEEGKRRILAAGVPFSRPDDYFAEMIKSDEHMARIRQRLLDEAQSIQASELARKQREAKKFGKKVQIEKQLERERQRKQELEKIKMARKKQDSTQNEDGFDVSIGDDDVSKASHKKSSQQNKKKMGHSKNSKRVHKDKKFGFGGPKRNQKSNTAKSTDDLSSFNVKKMKGQRKVSKKTKFKK